MVNETVYVNNVILKIESQQLNISCSYLLNRENPADKTIE